MKIAIAFFGLPRCSSLAVPTIEQNIFANFPKDIEYKCFYHFYQQAQVVNPRSGENGLLDESNYRPFLHYEGFLDDPLETLVNLPIESLKTFGDAWNDDFHSLRNLLLQLYSLKKVTGLLKAYSPDVVLFARPDLVYHDPILPHVYMMANKIKKSVFVPNWQWAKGINDTFAVCGDDAYEAYGSRLDEVLEYCEGEKRPLHSERLLKYVLLKNKMDIYHLNVKASRVRIGGVIVEENFVPYKYYFFARFTNPVKRMFFITELKTKIKTYLFLMLSQKVKNRLF